VRELSGAFARRARPPNPSAAASLAARVRSFGDKVREGAAVTLTTVRRSRRLVHSLLPLDGGDEEGDGNCCGAERKPKPMGVFGSFFFLSNLITGPGVLAFPVAYLYSGGTTTSVLIVGYTVASVLACIMISHCVRIYRDLRLQKRGPAAPHATELDHVPHLEMETLVRGAGVSTVSFLLFQFLFLGSCVLMAISCIVVTAQSCDQLSLILFGNSWGLQLTPRPRFVASCPAGAYRCPGAGAFAEVAAQEGGALVSLGYLLTVALTAPLSLIEISEEFQVITYFISLTCAIWLVCKFVTIAVYDSRFDYDEPVSAVLPKAWEWNPGLALEVCFYSWTISFAIPMWLDELDPDIEVGGALINSFTHRMLLDVALGVSGAMAFPDMPPNGLNVLQAVSVHPNCGVWTESAGVLFVITCLATSIVDYAMVATRNLEAHTGERVANLLGVGLPFASGWLFYFGQSFADMINTAAPLLNGAIQFCVPAGLYLVYARLEASEGTPVADKLLGWRIPLPVLKATAGAMFAGTVLLILATYLLPTLSETSKGGLDYADYSREFGV